jgi:phosphoglycerate dehydrogenase-like enzyme
MNRLHCAILDDYQNVALKMADWSPLASRVACRSYDAHFATDDALVAAVDDCEIVVIMRERTSFDAKILARLPRLKLLVTSGMRNAAVDLVAAKAQGVTVCGTASSSVPPSELTWALILGLARNIAAEAAAMRAVGPWQMGVGSDLHGRHLGILGLGKIGSRVAAVGQAFGMNVSAWSEHLTQERAQAAGVSLAPSKAALFASSDVVSIHLVSSPRTDKLVGAAELRLMRSTAFLVNTSRAAIVDQDALIDALRGRKIAGAGLDVFDQEPLPNDHPFRSLPNVLATPHLGYVSQDNYQTYYQETVEDITAFLAAAPVRVLG